MGIFWKKSTPKSALWAALLTIPLSAALKFLAPGIPFIDRMGIVFLLLIIQMIVMSLANPKDMDPSKAITLEKELFTTGFKFKIGSFVVCAILAALYIIFW